jgi:hypothetical protein
MRLERRLGNVQERGQAGTAKRLLKARTRSAPRVARLAAGRTPGSSHGCVRRGDRFHVQFDAGGLADEQSAGLQRLAPVRPRSSRLTSVAALNAIRSSPNGEELAPWKPTC